MATKAPPPPRVGATATFAPRIDRGSPMPLYAQVKQNVQAEILRRNLRPGDAFPSENELCSTLSLSRSTVARAVAQLARDGVLSRYRGKGTFVKRIDRLNMSRGHGQGSILCILSRLVAPESLEEFFWPMIHSVVQAVEVQRGRCSLITYSSSESQLNQLLQDVGMGYYAGIVLFSQDEEMVERLSACGVPLVAITVLPPQMRISTIYNDNELGSEIGLNYLKEQGHGRIGVIGGKAGNLSADERLAACHTWTRQHDGDGVELIHAQISSYDPQIRRAEVRQFIEAHDDLDAIFGLHDSVAIDAMAVLSMMEIKIPQQVAVLGYDDTVSASKIHPSLTTVAVDKVKIGQTAAKLLNNLVQDGPLGHIVSRIAPHLVRRESA